MKKFLSGSLVLVIGTIFMSGLNYAYNLFINRLLTPADFATYTALLGILTIALVPIGAVQAVSAKYAADYAADGHLNLIRQLLVKLTKKLLLFGLGMFIFFLIFPKAVASLLRAGDSREVVLAVSVMGVAFLFQLLLPISRGILQGTQRFFALAINLIIDAAGRLFLGLFILLPLTGQPWGLALREIFYGRLKVEHVWVVALGITATILGSLGAYLLAFIPLRTYFQQPETKRTINVSELLKFSQPALLMVIFLAILFNIDVVLVKRFSEIGGGITPDNAGEYATISTLAKIVFYFTGPVVSVMFPMIANMAKRGERHYKLLFSTLVSVFVVAGAVWGVFALVPVKIIHILTPNYVDVASWLAPMTLIFLLFSLVNVMTNYYLSLKSYDFLWPLGLAAVAEVVVLEMFHNSVAQVIQSVIIVQATLLALLLLLYVVRKWRQIKLLTAGFFGRA